MSHPSPKSGRIAVAIALLASLTACDDPVPTQSPPGPSPAATVHPHPVEVVEPPPQPDPLGARCRFGFTANDANESFTVVGALEAGPCTLRGLRALGSQLKAEWTVPGSDPQSAVVGVQDCDEGESHGVFVLVEFADGLSQCTGLREGLIAAMDKETLPLPTDVREQDSDTPGPDGDGKPPPPGATPTANSSMPPGMELPTAAPPPLADPPPSSAKTTDHAPAATP